MLRTGVFYKPLKKLEENKPHVFALSKMLEDKESVPARVFAPLHDCFQFLIRNLLLYFSPTPYLWPFSPSSWWEIRLR